MDLNRHTPQEMEEAIRRSIELIGEKECGSFDAMLAPRLIAVNHEEKSCTLSYHIADWMSNPIGIAHGGVLCAIADLSMGTLSKFYAKAATITPTVSIHLNYLRPVPLDGEIIVVSSIDFSTSCTAPSTMQPDRISPVSLLLLLISFRTNCKRSPICNKNRLPPDEWGNRRFCHT